MSTVDKDVPRNFNLKNRRWKVALVLPVLLPLLLLLFGFGYEWISNITADKRYPMPGRMVEAGGFRLHMHTTGSAKPTVVFETGSGEPSWSWRAVSTLLASHATVVTYDRAGYAWSESSPRARTGANIVYELHTALKNSGTSGPYILVGHSLGGMYMRLFAQTYPEDTAALVLVDARDEDNERRSLEVLGSERLQAQPSPSTLAWLKRSGILRMFQNSLLEGFVDEPERGRFVDIAATPAYFHAKAEEATLAYLTEDAVRSIKLGTIPVRIISRGVPVDGTAFGLSSQASASLERIWQEGQRHLLTISADTKQIIAPNSGHYVMKTEPNLIADTILSLCRQR